MINEKKILQMQMAHQQEVDTVKREKDKLEYDAKLKVMEANNNKHVFPYGDLPSWWNPAIYGSWNFGFPFYKLGSLAHPCWKSSSYSHQISNNNRTALSIGGKGGAVQTVTGYSTGIHTWILRVAARPSTCMLGVAPSSVSTTSVNYSTNGYYVDFNGGARYPAATAYRSGGMNAGNIVMVTLDCYARTLSYCVDGTDCGVSHSSLPAVELFLTFDNNTTGNSQLELL